MIPIWRKREIWKTLHGRSVQLDVRYHQALKVSAINVRNTRYGSLEGHVLRVGIGMDWRSARDRAYS
jgi:hypothetical protein